MAVPATDARTCLLRLAAAFAPGVAEVGKCQLGSHDPRQRACKTNAKLKRRVWRSSPCPCFDRDSDDSPATVEMIDDSCYITTTVISLICQ